MNDIYYCVEIVEKSTSYYDPVMFNRIFSLQELVSTYSLSEFYLGVL